MRCTRSFPLRYPWWEGLMNDCITFYNALVTKDKNYVFTWIDEQLSVLCSGLEGFVDSYSWTFESYKEYGVSFHTEISGDDFWILKADKMAQSLQFIKNIKELPIEVDGGQYITRIINACNKIHPRLNTKIESVNNELSQAEKEFDGIKTDLIVLIKKEFSFYPHRKYGTKKYVQETIEALDKWLSFYTITARRKRQRPKDNIRQVNLKISDARNALKKVRDLQGFLGQLINREEQLSKNLNEISIEK